MTMKMHNFHRNHRFYLKDCSPFDAKNAVWYGDTGECLLLLQKIFIDNNPGFLKSKKLYLTFYSCPEVLDFLAKKPNFKKLELQLLDGNGNFSGAFIFHNVTLTGISCRNLKFDYKETDILTIGADFKFKKMVMIPQTKGRITSC